MAGRGRKQPAAWSSYLVLVLRVGHSSAYFRCAGLLFIVAESVLCVRTDTVLCKRSFFFFFFFFSRLNLPAKFSFFLTCICFARFLSTDLYQPRAHIKSRWPSRQTNKRTLVRTARTNTCREYGLGQSSCSPNAAKRCSGQRQQVSVNWNGHGAETYLHPSQHIM